MKQTPKDPLLNNYISSWGQRANRHHNGKAPPSHLEALGRPPSALKIAQDFSFTYSGLPLYNLFQGLKSLAHPGIPNSKIRLSWLFLFQPTQ